MLIHINKQQYLPKHILKCWKVKSIYTNNFIYIHFKKEFLNLIFFFKFWILFIFTYFLLLFISMKACFRHRIKKTTRVISPFYPTIQNFFLTILRLYLTQVAINFLFSGGIKKIKKSIKQCKKCVQIEMVIQKSEKQTQNCEM